MLIFSNSLSIDWSSFFRALSISFNSNSSRILLLRDHNGNKAYNLLFLCNPYNQFSAIKIFLVTLFFFIVEYIILKQFVKLLRVKYTYSLKLLTQQQPCTTPPINRIRCRKEINILAIHRLLFLAHLRKVSITCWSKRKFDILYSNRNIEAILLYAVSAWPTTSQ